ncbi:hypothetical protein [Flavobacterium bizetiae]|uniref:hypothetical protein n=1 Tax=Flavobacterium bizetiae TaxID=2704140 RepID=UPI003757262E
MEINISDLNTFLNNRFLKPYPDLIYEGYGDYESNEIDILYEIENYGIKNISDLEKIIPNRYIEAVTKLEVKLNYLGTLRVLLILNDSEKYIKNYNDFNYRNFWEIGNIQSLEPFFDYFNISTEEIITKTKD